MRLQSSGRWERLGPSIAIVGFGFFAACATSSSTQSTALVTGEVPTDPNAVRQAKEPEIGYFPLPKALGSDPTRLKIPPLDFNVLKPERIKLANQVTLYLVPDHAAPLISLHAMVIAGTVDDPPDKVGRASVTFELMPNSGTAKLDANQLDDLLEFHAADVHGGASEEYSFLEMNIRSQDLQELFPVYVDLLLRPRFQKNRFEVAISRLVESIHRRADSVDGLAARALRKAVYGPDSVFAREITEKSVKALAIEDLKAFHRRAVVPAATALVVTGDFNREAILALIDRYLGAWKGGEKIARSYPPQRPLQGRVIFVPKDTAQAKIRIGGYGFVRLSPQEYAIRVMNTALGGGLGAGRLFREVRRQRGLAYHASSSAIPGPNGGLFYAAADTKPESTLEATEAMLKILRDVTGPLPLTGQELALAADSYLNSFAFRFDSADKIAVEKAVFDIYGYPEDYLDTFRKRIGEVTPAAALDAAKSLIRPETFQIVVVGPRDKVKDLSSLAPVTVVEDVELFR